MRRQVSMSFFLLLLLYLITVACILEISLGSCWHNDECMGQRSTLHHNIQLFISLNNQYAIIQWPLLDAPTSTHSVFTTLSLSKHGLSRLCRKQYGLMLAQRYFKGQRSSINHKIKLFCKLVQRLKYMCRLCPNQISITIWKFTTWVCIEHELKYPLQLEGIDWCMASTQAKVKVIISLFLLFSNLFFYNFDPSNIPVSTFAQTKYRQKCKQQKLDKLKEVKTPWVLDGASSNYHSMIA